jgi:hypothetical protein
MTTINILTATIGAGQSLSSVVDCSNNFVVGIIMPNEWTSARVSLSVSIDNIAFQDLFTFDEKTGTSATEFLFNVTPGTIVAINPNAMLMARYLKLRSGTRDRFVVQKADRIFGIVTVNQVTTVQQ